MDLESAMQRLKKLPLRRLGVRKNRLPSVHATRVPEVIYCEGKPSRKSKAIVKRIAEHHSNILASRASHQVYDGIREVVEDCVYHEMARMVVINPRKTEKVGNIA